MTLSDDAFRDLLERGQQITDMTASEGWQVLVSEVEEKAREKYDMICRGKLTHEEYIRETAWLEGARFVTAMPARKNMEIAAARDSLAELVDA